MNRRLGILGALVAAAVLALGAVLALTATGDGDGVPPLRATPAAEVAPAPVTAGRDATGAPVRVPVEGRPAVVTFLFANCPTVCPLVGTQLSAALDRLDPAVRDGVDVVAVSVDPAGDTPAAVRAFLATHRLTGRMRYIVGERADLEPLWDAWGVLAQPEGEPTASVHTARVVLVDRRGRQVGSYPGGTTIPPDDLAADITALARG